MKKYKYDIIIYTSCFIALILLICSLKDFSNTYGLKKTEIDTIEPITYEEPQELININKEEIIYNYLNNIYNRTVTDDYLTYTEINSWQSYTITNIKYIKTITNDYYEYQADINSESIANESKTLTFYIAKSPKNNDYIVKTSRK